MEQHEHFGGSGEPFEGDRALVVRGIPEGARITRAQVTVTPVAPPKAALFEELIDFVDGRGSWGATQSAGGSAGLYWTEVDFHNRRTLARFQGANLPGAGLQLDLGGIYVEINAKGAVKVPDEGTPLALPDDGVVPALTASRVKLTQETAPVSPLTIDRVTVRSVPTNLQARFGSLPTFWARPGELSRPETTPDVAPALQEALSQADVEGGFYRVPLVVHSDTIARLDVELAVEFTLEHSVLPGGLAETTLVYDHSTLPKAGSAGLAVAVPAGARVIPSGRRPRALGAFEASRVAYGPTGEVTVDGSLALLPAQSLARPLTVPADVAVSSLDLFLAVISRAATVQVDVFDDTDGKPWNEPLLPRPVIISLDRDLAQGVTWVNTALPAEFQFRAGRRYWLVAQCLTGEAAWSVQAATGPVGMQHSQDGGLSWRAATVAGADTVEGLMRLRVVPPGFTMPIQLQVGSGASAERVSLARFEPLGRVEIDLDSDEVTGALNRYLAGAASGRCHRGEHVHNGDFEAWQRTADLPTGSSRLTLPFAPERIVVSGDGCVAFAFGVTVEGSALVLRVAIVDVFRDRVSGLFSYTTSPSLTDAVASGDGDRLYVLVDGSVVVVLTRADDQAKVGELAASGASSLALSPDGVTLYVAGTEVIADPVPVTPGLRPAAEAVNYLDAYPTASIGQPSQTASRQRLELGSDEPGGLAVSPDGDTLYVLSRLGALIPVGTAGLERGSDPLSLPGEPRSPVISRDGTTLLTVHQSEGKLSVVDLTRRRARVLQLETTRPSAVAVSPDARYGFVAQTLADDVAVVDLRAGRVIRRIPVAPNPVDVVITPDGARIYVVDHLDAATEGMTVLLIGALVPEDWVVTAGRVRPMCLPPFGHVAVIGGTAEDDTPTATAALAQVVPVMGGCRYEFRFAGLASSDGASAEVHWLGASCESMRTDSLPIRAIPPSQDSTLVVGAEPSPALAEHEAVLGSPDGATQAEIRFTAPPSVEALVEGVSFAATDDLLANAALQLDQDDLLTGWEVSPPAPPGLVVVAEGDRLRLANAGPGPVALGQTASAEAGQTYRLEVEASPAPGSTVDSQLEVAWISAAGDQTGSPMTLRISSGVAAHQAAEGEAPAGTSTVEVRIRLSPGSALHVWRVSFRPVVTLAVPLTFVAESPGELTLSGWQVAFDVEEAPSAPPVPSNGLCRPRPPQPVPGERDDAGHCPTCEGVHEMSDSTSTVTHSGQPALVRRCSNCGSRVVLPGLAGAAPRRGLVRGTRLPLQSP